MPHLVVLVTETRPHACTKTAGMLVQNVLKYLLGFGQVSREHSIFYHPPNSPVHTSITIHVIMTGLVLPGLLCADGPLPQLRALPQPGLRQHCLPGRAGT